MPYRKVPLVAGEIYHVFNRSIARQPIFKTKSDYQRFIDVVNYYRYQKLPLRFSHFKRLTEEQKEQFIQINFKNDRVILEILAFCVMPNHFHFLLRPRTDSAISDFMRYVQNSYSTFFNTKNERSGSLVQAMFKAVRIESDEQLNHVSRYIHLNPVSAHIINIDKIDDYEWSSYKNYVSDKGYPFINTEEVLSHFKSKKEYKQFVLDQADYQRELEKIKHLILE